MYEIESLWIYPVKSLAGVSVQAAEVAAGGFVDDRRWMLVDAETGVFMSQRKLPQMALIYPSLDADNLTLKAHGHAPLIVSRQPSSREMEVGVWSDRFMANIVDEAANQWCSAVMGRPCVLVKKQLNTRVVKTKYTQALQGVIDEVSFADAFPFLVVGSATLDELNQKLDHPITIRQFRPNLVLKTDVPGVEDTWHGLEHDALSFYCVKPCDRCVLINVDPETGRPSTSKEPLKTLSTYRRAEDGKVYFGQNLVHHGDGQLRVGDVLSVFEDTK